MNNGDKTAYPCEQHLYHSGLTKREYFAGLALQTLIGTVKNKQDYEHLSKGCVNAADRLLEALEEKITN